MLRHPFRLSLAAAGLALLLAPRPAPAQYPVGDRRSEMSVGGSYSESYGPGYTFYYPAVNLAGRYNFYPGKYTGDYRASRFATSEGRYSTTASGYSPIFFTSLNYPGIYGSYTTGLAGSGVNVVPPVQTRPDNLPSDNPVGAPYAPLSRPLADVPRGDRVELTTRTALTTRVEPRARRALVDVHLPADASLSFQGVTMSETGGVREFQSPPLDEGRTYTYDLRATWTTREGREVVRSRYVKVRAGEHVTVDLNREMMPPAGESTDEQRPTLRTQPLPPLRSAPRSGKE
jgi:uncharacterized protein (TIGR03000 family)